MASAEGVKTYKPRHGNEVSFDALVPNKKYIINTNGTSDWFRGTFDRSDGDIATFSYTNMFGEQFIRRDDLAGNDEGNEAFSNRYGLTLRFYKNKHTFYEYTSPGFTSNGGKRRNKKKTRKGIRKSRRATRRN